MHDIHGFNMSYKSQSLKGPGAHTLSFHRENVDPQLRHWRDGNLTPQVLEEFAKVNKAIMSSSTHQWGCGT